MLCLALVAPKSIARSRSKYSVSHAPTKNISLLARRVLIRNVIPPGLPMGHVLRGCTCMCLYVFCFINSPPRKSSIITHYWMRGTIRWITRATYRMLTNLNQQRSFLHTDLFKFYADKDREEVGGNRNLSLRGNLLKIRWPLRLFLVNHHHLAFAECYLPIATSAVRVPFTAGPSY